jgi:hypothetical protein
VYYFLQEAFKECKKLNHKTNKVSFDSTSIFTKGAFIRREFINDTSWSYSYFIFYPNNRVLEKWSNSTILDTTRILQDTVNITGRLGYYTLLGDNKIKVEIIKGTGFFYYLYLNYNDSILIYKRDRVKYFQIFPRIINEEYAFLKLK